MIKKLFSVEEKATIQLFYKKEMYTFLLWSHFSWA